MKINERLLAKTIIVVVLTVFMILLYKYWMPAFYAFGILGIILLFSWALATLEK